MAHHPTTPQDFAISVVQKLRAAKFEAYWAGGCVRDRLLNFQPKDYDVATDATPSQIRDVFDDRRTINVGASFGVVTIIGPRSAGQVEVATFRQDGPYSDGRRPDTVRFCSAKEDAMRRDFTINGMFFDPIERQVIDFVGGQADLKSGVIRCIGEASQRIDEDKLRMLRAVRFAVRLGFEIHADSLQAIRDHAHEIQAVSAERIANEMRRILISQKRDIGLRLLQQTKLRPWIFGEYNDQPDETWEEAIELSKAVEADRFELAVAAILWPVINGRADGVVELSQRWKLANSQRDLIRFVMEHESLIEGAVGLEWPGIQRVLIQPYARHAVQFASIVCAHHNRPMDGIEFCEAKLKLPEEELNPRPLINGDDLKKGGIPTGPHFRSILESIRDLQLNGKISTQQEAASAAENIWREYQLQNTKSHMSQGAHE